MRESEQYAWDESYDLKGQSRDGRYCRVSQKGAMIDRALSLSADIHEEVMTITDNEAHRQRWIRSNIEHCSSFEF